MSNGVACFYLYAEIKGSFWVDEPSSFVWSMSFLRHGLNNYYFIVRFFFLMNAEVLSFGYDFY